MRLVASPSTEALSRAQQGEMPVLLYGRTDASDAVSIGAAVKETLERKELCPPQRAWDLLSVALSVIAADNAVRKKQSPDGWTRVLDLSIAVHDVDFWTAEVELLTRLLCFLTGDIWSISIAEGGYRHDPLATRKIQDGDCVSLLSGGLDSFTGAVDLASNNCNPLLVSQVVHGDADKQRVFAEILHGGLPHLQLNHNVCVPGTGDTNQRARSIIFLAYGILAATALQRYRDGDSITLYACENGFISINPPLTDLRIGSLSTRTTHPTYLGLFQTLLDRCGLRVVIENPYQFKTKGGMLRECKDQSMLAAQAFNTTSCGKFIRAHQHCGRCLPCLVRRAAFMEWGQQDLTAYTYEDLGRDHAKYANFDDVRAAAMAIKTVEEIGVDEWVGPQLCSPFISSPDQYLNLIELGVCELGIFLQEMGVK